MFVVVSGGWLLRRGMFRDMYARARDRKTDGIFVFVLTLERK